MPWKVRRRYVVPGKKYIVSATKKIHPSKITSQRLEMMNRSSVAEACDESGVEHSQAEIALLSLMHKVLSVTAQLEEHIAAYCVRCADVSVCHPNPRAIRRLLADDPVLVHVAV